METPLTPLEFQRRSRALYPDRECVVDGGDRLTYAQFFDRCDRWSAALQRLGVRKGDRVAYLSLNTASHLESFYAVPQIGAVLVPINFRLKPQEIAYIVRHSGAKVVCAHAEFLDTVDEIRGECPGSSTTWPSRAPATAGSTTGRCVTPSRARWTARQWTSATC